MYYIATSHVCWAPLHYLSMCDMTHLQVCPASRIYLLMRDMTQSYVWRGSCVSVPLPVHMCDIAHSYVWLGWFMCLWKPPCVYVIIVMWLSHMCDVTHSCVCRYTCVCRCTLIRVTWLDHMCGMPYPYVRRASVICATGRSQMWHMRDMAHSYVWRDSFVVKTTMCVLYAWHHSVICVTWPIRACAVTRACAVAHQCVWHDLFICVACLIHMCDVPQSYVRRELLFMTDMTHSYMWRGLFAERDQTNTNILFNVSVCSGSESEKLKCRHTFESYVLVCVSVCVSLSLFQQMSPRYIFEYKYQYTAYLLHSESHFYTRKSQSIIQFSSSLLPRSVAKRPRRFQLEIAIK